MGAMVPPALLSAAGTAGTAASFLNPFTIGFGLAGLGTSIFGGLNQASATRQAGDDYLKAALIQDRTAREGQRIQQEMGRQKMFADMAMGIGNRVAQLGYGADLDFGRQLEGAMFKERELEPVAIANRMAERRAVLGLEGSREAREAADRASRRKMKESVAEFAGKYSGMFGPIAPVNVRNLVV
jgi:hypothetical protein